MRITEDSSAREMRAWLRGASKAHIVAVCIRIAKCTDLEIPIYGTKEEILGGLEGVSRKRLWDAIDAVFPTTDDNPEEDCDDCDSDNEDESDDSDDETDDEDDDDDSDDEIEDED